MNDTSNIEKDPELEKMRQRLLSNKARIYRSWGACWGPGEIPPFCVFLSNGKVVVEHYENNSSRKETRGKGMKKALDIVERDLKIYINTSSL